MILRFQNIIRLFQMEVNNGGIHQYFLNSAGNDAGVAVSFLREIGATDAESILARAIERFGSNSVPNDRAQRLKILEQLPLSAFDDLTSAFYEQDFGILDSAVKAWIEVRLHELDLPGGIDSIA